MTQIYKNLIFSISIKLIFLFKGVGKPKIPPFKSIEPLAFYLRGSIFQAKAQKTKQAHLIHTLEL